MRHPYSPANKKGMILRVTTTADSVRLPNVDRGPCTYIEQGQVCGRPERLAIHREPYFMVAHARDGETRPALKGAGKDAPIL